MNPFILCDSIDIRNMFSFALPGQVLDAINVYSSHFYGAMLWDLFGDTAGQVYRSWNTCVKLVWDLPRSTHNYFVEHLLAKDWVSIREKIMVQYVKFMQRLPKSVSKEIRILHSVVSSDVRSVTGKNCLLLRQEFSLDPMSNSASQFHDVYKLYSVPDQDEWRISLLENLLAQRYEMQGGIFPGIWGYNLPQNIGSSHEMF